MIFKYIHHSKPDKIKSYVSEQALNNNLFFQMSQDEFDITQILLMEKSRQQGFVLSYEIYVSEESDYRLVSSIGPHSNRRWEVQRRYPIYSEQGIEYEWELVWHSATDLRAAIETLKKYTAESLSQKTAIGLIGDLDLLD